MVEVCIDEVLRFLGLLAEARQVVELRLLGVQLRGRHLPLTMSGYFDRHEALAAAAAKYGDSARGVYVTLNPVNPALLARAANRLRTVGKDDSLTCDGDIVRRRWLPIDLDAVRPAGISSCAEEHDQAITRVYEIRNALHAEGWPNPIVGDSGNGGHLLYLVDLPVNDGGMVKRCLNALAQRFDDDRVKVDQSVFNPARIWKLYGTVSRKGDNLTDRPHRSAHMLEPK